MKTAIILRYVELNRKLGNPGFEDTDARLLEKFNEVDNNALMKMYENTITIAFKEGKL